LLLLLCLNGAAQASPEHLAHNVTIYRDHWGTPHVFGKTDASTIFGFAYAQAEDNFPQLEENFVLATGRGAEVYGQDLVQEDLLNRTLAIEDHAKSDYQSVDSQMRTLCDAFAQGVNFYLARHPNVHPRGLTRIEPWYPLAFIRYNYYQNGFARDPKLGETPFSIRLASGLPEPERIERLGHRTLALSLGVRHAVHRSAPAILWSRPSLRRPDS